MVNIPYDLVLSISRSPIDNVLHSLLSSIPDSFPPSQLMTLLPTSLTEAIKREFLQPLNTSSTRSLGLGRIFTLPPAAWVNPLARLAVTPPLMYQIPCLSSAQGLHSIKDFPLYCIIPISIKT